MRKFFRGNDRFNAKALLLCASHNDLGLVRALKKLGYMVIATGTKIDLTGRRWVDKWIPVDYSDKAAVLEIAKKEQIDVICQCCNDFGVYTAAYVAEQLDLPGYDSYETTCILHNKDRFKYFASKNGILTPVAYSFDDQKAAMARIHEMQFPVIVKPVDASAGNGVNKIEARMDIELAVKLAFRCSKSQRIVVEPFLSGKQYGFCTFLQERKVVAVASNNEYSFLNPYRVEIDTYPADTYHECHKYLIEEIERIADILHLRDGIFHLQYIYSEGKPWIIEVMRRILGNMYSVPANQLTGLDWDYWETRARCGLSCSEFPAPLEQEGYFAYKAIMAPAKGIIESVEIPKEYRKYIFADHWLLRQGDTIQDHLKQPIGFLFMMFQNRKEMEKLLLEGYRNDLVKMRREQ